MISSLKRLNEDEIYSTTFIIQLIFFVLCFQLLYGYETKFYFITCNNKPKLKSVSHLYIAINILYDFEMNRGKINLKIGLEISLIEKDGFVSNSNALSIEY